MMGTYASAVLICAASLLVGRSVLGLPDQRSWSWLEPAVGFGAVLTVTGSLARAPGRATTATVGLAVLVLIACAVVIRRPRRSTAAWREGLPVAVVLLLVLSLPFASSGHWGLLGAEDLQMHLDWADWLRDGSGAAPPAGFPIGPHGLADAIATVPGIDLGPAFVGEAFAIVLLGGLTALGAIGHLRGVRRTVAAALVALPYLIASSFAHGAFRETAEALFVLATGIALLQVERQRNTNLDGGDGPGSTAGKACSPRTAWASSALAGGAFFSNGFVGLLWPLAIVGRWSLNRPKVRRAFRPRALTRLPEQRPPTLTLVVVMAVFAILAIALDPFGVNGVAAHGTLTSVAPPAGLGVWPVADYRSDNPAGLYLGGAVALATIVAGLSWWLRRREAAVPVAFGVSSVIFLLSPLFGGEYSSSQALVVVAPLAMLVAVRPLLEETGPNPTPLRREWPVCPSSPWPPLRRLGWVALAIAFTAGAVYSSFLALHDAPVTAYPQPSMLHRAAIGPRQSPAPRKSAIAAVVAAGDSQSTL